MVKGRGEEMFASVKAERPIVSTIDKSKIRGLDYEKKMILKSSIGSVSTPDFDLNKLRDYSKYGDR
jgi:hypothetical protein